MFIRDVQFNAKKKKKLGKNLYKTIQCSRCNVMNVELLGVVWMWNCPIQGFDRIIHCQTISVYS